MRYWKSAFVLSAVFVALGTVPAEEASAQGPIIRKMRQRLNGGRALLPFVDDMEEATREAVNRARSSVRPTGPPKRPTPAAAPKSGSGTRTPTPATRQPTLAKPEPTPANPQARKNPTIKLQSPGQAPETGKLTATSKGFGMELRQVKESFYIGQIDPRGNAAQAGLRSGDLIEEIGGAPVKVVEEFEAIAKAMQGGDRVEFKVSRRGSRAKKVIVQYGEAAPIEEAENANSIDVSPLELDPLPTKRTVQDRYEPSVGSGLRSVYEGQEKPSSVLAPTPSPRGNRVQSLGELDFPALDGGR